MKLQLIDWIIVAASLLVCFVPALFFGKRAGKSTSEFFVSGRAVPWWLAGLSMVATTFSSDTPNLVTNIVRQKGVAGNWVWWAYALTGVATVFFYARLWRRSEVMTDLEFYEIRYAGKAASVVRGFRSVYLGLLFNCFIMASVNLAACKIANVLFGLPRWQTLLLVGVLNAAFAAHSGLWGVLVIDMIQFFIKMTAVIAAAYFAVQHIGGLGVMVEKLSAPMLAPDGKTMLHYLNFLPDFTNNWDLALAVFIMPIAVQWWATWYPGAEPGGGSYIAQRMLASKSEKDSLGAVLFFNVAHYVLRPWPWLLVALCSLLVFPQLSDIQAAFPNMDPTLLGHDIAFPAMLKFLPVGFIGLMVGGLIAAHSSTILTHLNWGASYLVHDFYQRFIGKGAHEKHYVLVGRVCTYYLFLVSAGMVYLLESAKDNFDIMLQVGAGTGLLYLLRWFWWRITAWCEVVAMISSFGVSIALLVLKKQTHLDLSTANALLLTIAVTTVCWMLTALFGPQTERRTLVEFYKKVRPPGPGWKHIREQAGISKQDAAATHEKIPLALLGWTAGCAVIWSSLFTVGNFLYGRTNYAWILLGIFIVSSLTLLWVIKRLWADNVGSPDRSALLPAETVRTGGQDGCHAPVLAVSSTNDSAANKNMRDHNNDHRVSATVVISPKPVWIVDKIDFLFSFYGRISRFQYWMSMGLVFLPLEILSVVCLVFDHLAIYLVLLLTLLWPHVAIHIKRLHDRNLSGLLYVCPLLAYFILLLGSPIWLYLMPLSYPLVLLISEVIIGIWGIWLFGQIGFLKGTSGRNRFGPDPLLRPGKALDSHAP